MNHTRHRPAPAEAFPPGDLVREELEARGWTQGDLARLIGRPIQLVNQIVNGRKAITAQTAVELAEAFGTSPQVWMNLQATWALSKTRPRPDIARRARAMRAA